MFKMVRRYPAQMILSVLLFAAAFLALPSVYTPVFSPNQQVVEAQVPTKISCGGTCDLPGNPAAPKITRLCAGTLRCVKDPSGLPYQGICINPVGTACSATNPCCSITPTPRATSTPAATPVSKTTPGNTNPDGSTTPGTGSPVDPTVPASGVVGDCSGSTPGVPDGKVDMQDVDQFKNELNKVASGQNQGPTMACDFDKNGVVDIIDFTHFVRVGYAGQAQQNPTSAPTTGATSAPTNAPTVAPTATPATNSAVITP